MKTQTLGEYVSTTSRGGAVSLVLKTSSAPPPRLREQLLRFEQLGLPLDDVVLSLAAQAPVDPFGVFGALRSLGSWAFQAADCTALCVLDRRDKEVLAAMKIDLLSDDIVFIAKKGAQLEPVSTLTGEQISSWLRESGITEAVILGRIQTCVEAAVTAGRVG